MSSMEKNSIYNDSKGDGREILRAIRYSRVGVYPSDPLAYQENETSWDDFFRGTLSKALLPHFISISNFVEVGSMNKIIAEDGRLVDSLPDKLSERLCAGSEAVFAARDGAKGMQFLKNLQQSCERCSFTAAFAVHAAAFNIPLLQGMIAYAFVEWRVGKNQCSFGLENVSENEKLFLRESQHCSDRIRRILVRHTGSTAVVA